MVTRASQFCLCLLLGTLGGCAATGEGGTGEDLDGNGPVMEPGVGGQVDAGRAEEREPGQTLPGHDAQGGAEAGATVDKVMKELYAGDPLADEGPNLGWIGGACSAAMDCPFQGARCRGPEEGFVGGVCSSACARLCPDRNGPLDTVSFCTYDPADNRAGMCAARCDFDLLTDGCRRGLACVPARRFAQATVVSSVCLAPPADYRPPARCFAEMQVAGIAYERWGAWRPQLAGSHICWVEAPTRLPSPVAGVRFRYGTGTGDGPEIPLRVNCQMGRALVELARLAARHDIVEIWHLGTYNCRPISGSRTLSEHGRANALDIAALVRRDGTLFRIKDHWERGTPQTEKGRFLLQFTNDLYSNRIFRTILTPNYNSAHHDHLHVDLKAGGGFYKAADDGYYLGPNWGH
jgi:hypothetical protein